MTELMPWLAGLAALIVGFVGVYFRGKSTGKSETQAKLSTKINQQAAEAAQEAKNVERSNSKLSDDDVYLGLDGWVRNETTNRK